MLLLALPLALAAADPYDAWSQGRPVEAAAPLVQSARIAGRWDAWLDAGLAATAASQRGRALACLAAAHNLAPERPEPRDALRALGAELPTTWCERAGPLGLPGQGWTGVVLALLAGLLLGGCLVLRRGRLSMGLAGLALVLLVIPGMAAMWLDGRQHWVCTVRDTHALDSTGAPQQALAEGTLLHLVGTQVWANRRLIALPVGGNAWIAQDDITP